MFRSLERLPTRVVIDANVLLNACFIAGGSARQAIDHLKALGFNPIIDKTIEYEARTVLHRKRMALGLWFDPRSALDAFLRYAQIMSLPGAPLQSCRSINKADRHVYSAAMHYGAWVLTADLEFAVQCQDLQMPVRLPWDVVMEGATRAGKNPPLELVARYSGLSETAGMLFARGVPGSGAGMMDGRKFTACDVEHVGRVFYDGSAKEWVFVLTIGGEARARCPVVPDETWTVCGSYELDRNSGRGKASVRAYSTRGTTGDSTIEVRGRFKASWPGKISVGHTLVGSDYWNGGIGPVVIGPRPMTGKIWRALRRLPELAPDPFSANVLEAALRRVRAENGVMLVPDEREIMEQWV